MSPTLGRRNSKVDTGEAMACAVVSGNARAAIAVLCGLRGVDIPMASAFMTAFYPERYTIIDMRAKEALGLKRSFGASIDDYLA